MLDMIKGALDLTDDPGSSELPGTLLDPGPPTFGEPFKSAGGARFSVAAGSPGVPGSIGVLGGSALTELAMIDVCNGGVGTVALGVARVVCGLGTSEGVGEGP